MMSSWIRRSMRSKISVVHTVESCSEVDDASSTYSEDSRNYKRKSERAAKSQAVYEQTEKQILDNVQKTRESATSLPITVV
ncbi:unnamed protein product [Acanthoscelides obtectus]|uniref:Uncharacterized protein n=1 Tax=Acanthoscelides obtectus TaxID=200917 RepID=A0A9P0JYN4_ACAOB|nr:unnamed protein product [Acanthoscelides obtectus]CAK1633853.1 hypothetical protein AOBTE_LOCUS8436 [Acanthoscelides obtectus]